MRPIAFRLAAVLIGSLLGLVALEASLWIVSAAAPTMLLRSVDPEDAAAIRIVCVGDSHTFGVKVLPEEAYPARLEHHLEQLGHDASVVNFGVPGMNGAQVLGSLPLYLQQYRPHFVAVFVGANNGWNVAGRDRAEVQWATMLAQRIRLVRFARLFLAPSEVSVDEAGEAFGRAQFTGTLTDPKWNLPDAEGGREVSPLKSKTRASQDVLWARAREDFAEIVRLVAAHGARAILIKYPFPLNPVLQAVNGVITELGSDGRVLVVESVEIYARLRGDGAKVLFDDPGLHPRPVMYDEIARAAVQHVLAAP